MKDANRSTWINMALLLSVAILFVISILLAILGIWSWIVTTLYAVCAAASAFTLFNGYKLKKKLVLFLGYEAMQICTCLMLLGLRVVF